MADDRAPEKPPTLSEMQAEGMGITEALAFWNEIANDPDRTPAECWADLRARVSARRAARRAARPLQ